MMDNSRSRWRQLQSAHSRRQPRQLGYFSSLKYAQDYATPSIEHQQIIRIVLCDSHSDKCEFPSA